MSADNGIYIAEFSDGFRVIEAQGIKNIDYYPKGSKERKQVLKDYFRDSKVYPTIGEAIVRAHELYDEVMNCAYPILEYGINFIGKYEDFK